VQGGSTLLPSLPLGNGSSQGKLARESKYAVWEERELLASCWQHMLLHKLSQIATTL